MRSIWKGAINFGMVTIPVKMYTATQQKDALQASLAASRSARAEAKRGDKAESGTDRKPAAKKDRRRSAA